MSDSTNISTGELSEAEALLRRLKVLAYIGFACAIIVVVAYRIEFGGSISKDATDWAEFGDYISGLLNPAFSFLALMALLATFSLQIRELRISSRELKNSADALVQQNQTLFKQNFESSFFQVLRLHNDIVNSMDLRSTNLSGNEEVTLGRDCFKVFLRRLENMLSKDKRKDYPSFLECYDKFYSQHQNDIGHYFRLLYNIVKLVKQTPGIDQRFYTNIVRAQLSGPELKLIFYNCLSDLGSEKFKPLVEEFALLKTIPRTHLPRSSLLHEYKVEAFGGGYPVEMKE